MATDEFPRRTMAALLLLAVAVGVLASLGRWQLQRADERRALAQAIETGRQAPPVELAPGMDAALLQPWRPARATGQWRHDLSVLLENRNLDGRPGFWLATPLVLDAADGAAVLVLRGWLPRPLDGGAPPAWPRPAGEQTVTGELAARVPRLFELPGTRGQGLLQDWPAGPPPRMQNLGLDELARASGLTFLPAVLMQHTPDGDGLLRQWPLPGVDADKNVGYALQWFSFAAIAGIAWLVVAINAWRRRSGRATSSAHDPGDNS